MSSFESYVKANLWVISSQILVYTQGLISLPLIIKTAGPSVYGAYVLLATFLNVVFALSSFGVNFSRNRYLPAAEHRDEKRALFFPQFIIQFISVAVCALTIVAVYPYVKRKLLLDGPLLYAWLIVPYLLSMFLFGQISDYFRYTNRAREFNLATVVQPYLGLFFLLAIYRTTGSLSINGIFWGQSLAFIMASIPLAMRVMREIGVRPIWPKWRAIIISIKQGFPLVLNSILDMVLAAGDRYIIAIMLSVTAVGYYAPAYALGSLIGLLPKVSWVVLAPILSKTVDSGADREGHVLVDYTLKAFLMAAIPFVAVSMIMSKQLLVVFANADIADTAYMVTPIVAAATIFYGMSMIISNVLFVQLRTSDILRANLIAGASNIILNMILLYLYKNIMMAGVATLISYIIAFYYTYRMALKQWPVYFDYRLIAKVVAASLLMSVALVSIAALLEGRASHWVVIIIQVVMGSAIYGAMLIALRTFTASEMTDLRGLVMKQS